MGKKSRKQKKVADVVYTCKTVESKHGTGFVCDESASTACQSKDEGDGFPTESGHHLQNKASHQTKGVKCKSFHNSSFDAGNPDLRMPAMPAVANGERVEAFSSIGKNGTAHDDEISESVEMESACHVVEANSEANESEPFNGRKVQKQLFNKPGPKSMKSQESAWNSDNNQSVEQNNLETTSDESKETPDISVPEQEHDQAESVQVDDSVTEDVKNKENEAMHKANATETEEDNQIDTNDIEPEQKDIECDVDEAELEKDEVEAANIEPVETDVTTGNRVDSPSEFKIQESDEPVCDQDARFGHSSCTTSKPGPEGIVSEPEDHADKSDVESTAMSDTDITISSLDFDESGSKTELSETDISNAADLPEAQEPVVEFPTDSPVDDQPSYNGEESDLEGSFVADVIVNESLPNLDEVEEAEVADEVTDLTTSTRYKDTKDLDYASKVLDKLENDDFSFGRTLRSMSGRRSLQKGDSQGQAKQRGDSVASTNSSMSSIFSFNFGKRKLENREAEDVPPEKENKRVKAEEGVEPQGFFAKLTSPVINRLRGIKVASLRPAEEVNGHEEMAVALIAPPPPKRCIVM